MSRTIEIFAFDELTTFAKNAAIITAYDEGNFNIPIHAVRLEYLQDIAREKEYFSDGRIFSVDNKS